MIIFADKPEGITSFDVVHKVKKHFGYKKVGHCGTLDPLATGLMVLVTDEDTKKAQEYQGFDKTYDAVVDLSLKTDTWDIDFHDLKIAVEKPEKEITQTYIAELLQKLTPSAVLPIPAFSAKKVAGKRMYKSARAGKEIAADREMIIHGIAVTAYERPLVHLSCNVGSGTFIRSIAHWLGEQLGTGGVIRELRRTSIGEREIEKLQDLITFRKNETGYRVVDSERGS